MTQNDGAAGPPAFTAVSPVLLVDETYARIKAAVLRGDFAPGERLRDSVIAREMGVSRSPVREALSLLASEGLVDRSPNRSYTVAALADEAVTELCAMRIALEDFAVRHLIANGTDIGSARAALDDMAAAVESDDAVALAESDVAFHSAIVDAAGLARLSSAYRGIRDQLSLALRASLGARGGSEHMLERHTELYDLLVQAQHDGEAERIRAMFQEHILHATGVTLALA